MQSANNAKIVNKRLSAQIELGKQTSVMSKLSLKHVSSQQPQPAQNQVPMLNDKSYDERQEVIIEEDVEDASNRSHKQERRPPRNNNFSKSLAAKSTMGRQIQKRPSFNSKAQLQSGKIKDQRVKVQIEQMNSFESSEKPEITNRRFTNPKSVNNRRRQTAQNLRSKGDDLSEGGYGGVSSNHLLNYATNQNNSSGPNITISRKSRQVEERRDRIKRYDEESKRTIAEHLHKQKVTQKLGLDFNIYEDENELAPIGRSRAQTTKAAKTTSAVDKINQRKLRNLDTMSQISGKTGKKSFVTDNSPHKRKDGNNGSLSLGQSEHGIIQRLDAYKARKEPIPFGMSEKIWELDTYKQNFDNWRNYLSNINSNDPQQTRSNTQGNNRRNINKQESTTSFTAINQVIMRVLEQKLTNQQNQPTTSVQSNLKKAGSRSDKMLRGQSTEGHPYVKNRTMRTDAEKTGGKKDKNVEKKAYIPLIKREADDNTLVSQMWSLERFRREMFLLHEHPDTLSEITKGIRHDQQKIAQTLHNNQLLVRILEKQRDRYQQWMNDVNDEERKDPEQQRLPSIEPIHFDKYEETYEERNQHNYDYMRFYQTQDVTIGQIMEKNHEKKNEKDSSQITRKKALKSVKPSRPMYMSWYEPEMCIVFALLGEIKIVQVKQNGQKKTFQTMGSHLLDDLPVGMAVGSHSQNRTILVFVACQYFTGQKIQKGNDGSEEQNYVIILEVNPQKGWKVQEIAKIKPEVPQITKILYDLDYGLIIACYRGFIQHFDNINFLPVGKPWHNNMAAIGSEKLKAKAAESEQKKVEHRQFENWISDALQTKKLAIGETDETGKKRTGDNNLENFGSDVSFKAKKPKKRSLKQQRLDAEQEKVEEMERKKAKLRAATLKALKHRASEKQQVQTINCLDYSADLYLIAFGGVHGQIGILDSTTKEFIGMYDAHGASEVSAIYFYKKERQMISLSLEGDCAIWDAQKMVKVQTIRNKEQMQKTKHISTSNFDQLSGTLLLATSEVFRFKMLEDQETKIQIDQQLSVAANYLQQMKKKIDRDGNKEYQGIANYAQGNQAQLEEDEEDLKSKRSSKQVVDIAQKARSKMDQSMQIVSDILNYKKLPQMMVTSEKTSIRSFDKQSYTVLSSRRTRLIGCFINTGSGRMFTVDIDCLIRQWDLLSGVCIRSYPLEKPTQPGDQATIDNNLNYFKHRHQIQAIQLSPDQRVIAVAFQGGFIQLNNIFSGNVMYNKAFENQIDLGPQEISDLAFFHKQTNYWVAATLWDGKVAFLQRPLNDKGGEIIRAKKVESNHHLDVICLDITENNHMATVSLDHTIVFWNSYNAQSSKFKAIPEDLVYGSTVQSIKFVMRDSNDFLLLNMSNGDIFIFETQSETFVEPADFDSSKPIKSFSFAKVPKFSTIDIKKKRCDSPNPDSEQLYLLAVDEAGKEGAMFEFTLSEPSTKQKGVSERVAKLRAAHKKIFDIADVNIKFYLPKCPKIPNAKKAVVTVELLPQLDIFIIAQVSGQVGFYDIRSCALISYMNQEMSCPRIRSLIESTVSKQRSYNRKHNIDQFSDSDDDGLNSDLSTEDRESAINNNYINNSMALDNPNGGIISPQNMTSMPRTAKNATSKRAKGILSPAEFNADMLNSADGDYEDHAAQEMMLSGKYMKGDQATRNTFNATTRTKVSTQAWTATNMNSPSQ